MSCAGAVLVNASEVGSTPPSRSTFPSTVDPDDELHYLRIIDSAFALKPYGVEGDRVLHDLREQLRDQCMRSAGFEYTVVKFVDPDERSDGLALAPPLPELGQVQIAGYDAFRFPPMPIDQLADEQARANTERLATSDAWAAAMLGTESGGHVGCLETVDQMIRDSVGLTAIDQFAVLVTELAPLANPYLSDDPDLVAAKSAWAACMAVSGYAFAGPFHAEAEFLRPRGNPTPEEVAVATADLECRERSNYREAFLFAIGRGFEEWFAKNDGPVTELQRTTELELEALIRMNAALVR